jgi:quercetin dioxygenase-like cupin family protein
LFDFEPAKEFVMQSRSICVLVFLGSFALLGQDVVKVAPAGMVKVEYDDAQVRVLRFTESAGAKLPMHSHPAYVAVGLGNDVSRYTFPDGRSSEEKTEAGQAMFSQPVTHASENIGDTAMESVMVELKTKPADTVLSGAGDMVKLNPDACKVEKDNEYVRITRVKLPPHGKLAMHSHPTNVVVYVSGGHSKATTADGKAQESTTAD